MIAAAAGKPAENAVTIMMKNAGSKNCRNRYSKAIALAENNKSKAEPAAC